MQISWRGQTCIIVTVQKSKQEQIRVVFDPFGPEIGLKSSSLEADIALVTHKEGDHLEILRGEPFIVLHPGEYEAHGIFIQGIASQTGTGADNTIYILDAEGMRLCHLGSIGQSELTSEQVERIGNVDIAFLPVGGGDATAAREAARMLHQIEPRMAIPMQYAVSKLNHELAKVDDFLEVMGIKNSQPQQKLSVKARDLTSEETEIVILTL